jgi:hypothetical protein
MEFDGFQLNRISSSISHILNWDIVQVDRKRFHPREAVIETGQEQTTHLMIAECGRRNNLHAELHSEMIHAVDPKECTLGGDHVLSDDPWIELLEYLSNPEG